MKIKSNRREFMMRMRDAGGILAGGLASPSFIRPREPAAHNGPSSRITECLAIKTEAANVEARMLVATNRSCGDEGTYPTKIGNYHKGLPHNPFGEVDLQAYAAMCNALASEKPDPFEKIPIGGSAKLSNPQGGLAFDLEGCDSQQTSMATPPTLASSWRAGEMVEDYWMAVLRNVNFAEYAANDSTVTAVAELNKLNDFRGPKQRGQVNTQTLFRGSTPGDMVGPYVSQFLLQPVGFGALHLNQQIAAFEAATDYMTDTDSWLLAQNGENAYEENRLDPKPRYIRNGRDLSAYVHSDCPYQAYLIAALWMMKNDVPMNAGNPYEKSLTQEGFLTFGGPHVLSLLAEVSNRALKAVWYHKWYVHRTLRPEAYGGLVHWTMTGKRDYPLHADVLNSKAAAKVYSKHGTYLLPQAYPEGCPMHPSYGQGHAAVAGACVTVLKAFFATDNVMFYDPVEASADGLSLVPYKGPDVWQMSVTNELHKLAGNIAMARNFAGIHWRSDYDQALLLGESVAVSILRDQRATFNEKFDGFTFTKFDGTKTTV
jgi:hypothetical protein